MEIPHAEHNLRKSVKRLTCSKLKCYTMLNPKRNTASAKRGEPSEAKSGKPINVVHMSSTFAPSLTAAIIFRRKGSHDRYRKRGLHLPMDKKKTRQGSGLFSQKKCKERI